jgi:hypothetical protein
MMFFISAKLTTVMLMIIPPAAIGAVSDSDFYNRL